MMAESNQAGRAEAKRRSASWRTSFKDFQSTTRRIWRRERRVVAKAEFTCEANPPFVVTLLKYLYEMVYYAAPRIMLRRQQGAMEDAAVRPALPDAARTN